MTMNYMPPSAQEQQDELIAEALEKMRAPTSEEPPKEPSTQPSPSKETEMQDDRNTAGSEEDGIRAEALRQLRVRMAYEAKPARTRGSAPNTNTEKEASYPWRAA